MNRFYPSQPNGKAQIRLAHVMLEGMQVDVEIGIAPCEHGRVQRLTINVSVGFDDSRTRVQDSKEGLLEGFDYSPVRDCVITATRTKTYLLETVANRIADSVLALPHALTCDVKISKSRCWADVESTGVRVFREA